MQRVIIPGVGAFDRILRPNMPGASEIVEYREVAAEPRKPKRRGPALAAMIVGGLLGAVTFALCSV